MNLEGRAPRPGLPFGTSAGSHDLESRDWKQFLFSFPVDWPHALLFRSLWRRLLWLLVHFHILASALSPR